MFESPLTAVISLDTDIEAIHFYTEDAGKTPNHVTAGFRSTNFNEDLFQRLGKLLKGYVQKNATAALAKTSLVLPDHLFLQDLVNVPTIGKKAMETSVELAVGTVYKNKKDLLYTTYPVAQNKQFATYALVGARKDILEKLRSICAENQIGVQNITFAANAMVNGAMTVNSKLRNATFLLLDIQEKRARFAFVNKGRTVGSYSLPFGSSILYKTRLAAEDLLFDHATAHLLVLNAREKAKAKQLTIMGEEVLVDSDEQAQQTVESAATPENGKAGRKLPKFMLRETPNSSEGYVYENFRIFVKWALNLIANNSRITALGEIDTVYVNLPEAYQFLFDMVKEEEAENKVKFLPLVAGGVNDLDLFGAFHVKQYNKNNNF